MSTIIKVVYNQYKCKENNKHVMVIWLDKQTIMSLTI